MSGLVIPQAPIPVIVLTGYLGSGKTTVLKHLLAHPQADGTAVIVNEFGDVGLDHLLLERGDENTLLLDSGCLCCTVKSDLVTTLQSMLDRAERGELPVFDRIVIETTGLADPGSLIRAFWSDPLRLSRYVFSHTVTCVEAVNGEATLERHSEARRQAALADMLLITKTDLEPGAGVCRALDRLNCFAPMLDVPFGVASPDALLHVSPVRSDNDELTCGDSGHLADIVAVSASVRGGLLWNDIEAGLRELTQCHGDRLLRLKGLLMVDGIDGAVRVDAVQGLFHRPAILSPNRHERASSKLVAIAQGIDRDQLLSELTTLLDKSVVHKSLFGPAREVGLDRAGACRQMRGSQRMAG